MIRKLSFPISKLWHVLKICLPVVRSKKSLNKNPVENSKLIYALYWMCTFTLEKHIPRNIVYYSKWFSYPLLCNSNNNPFLNLNTSANHNEVVEIQPSNAMVKSLYPFLYLYCKISFFLIVDIYFFSFYIFYWKIF